MRRGERCPYCGLDYGRWHPCVLAWGEARADLWRESERARRERGDYSRRVTRRRILGRMCEAKREAWAEHVHWCEEEVCVDGR